MTLFLPFIGLETIKIPPFQLTLSQSADELDGKRYYQVSIEHQEQIPGMTNTRYHRVYRCLEVAHSLTHPAHHWSLLFYSCQRITVQTRLRLMKEHAIPYHLFKNYNGAYQLKENYPGYDVFELYQPDGCPNLGFVFDLSSGCESTSLADRYGHFDSFINLMTTIAKTSFDLKEPLFSAEFSDDLARYWSTPILETVPEVLLETAPGKEQDFMVNLINGWPFELIIQEFMTSNLIDWTLEPSEKIGL